MEPELPKKPETKFKVGDLISCSAFGRLINCSPQAARKLVGEKMTDGVSYLKDGNKILIDVEAAKIELRSNIKPSTCKNKQLLEFLDLPDTNGDLSVLKGQEWINDLAPQQVREELQKSELRISLTNERILNEEYIDRAEVYKNAEAAGIEIRNKLIGISARITPSLASLMPGVDMKKIDEIINAEMEQTLADFVNVFGQKDIPITE